MAFIPLPLCAKIVLNYTWSGAEVHNVLYAKFPVTPLLTDFDSLGSAVNGWLAASYLPRQSVDVTALGNTVTDMSTLIGGVYPYPLTAPIEGSIPTASVPNNTGIVTTFQTRLRGRSYRGRVYNIGLPSTDLADTRTVVPAVLPVFDGVWLDFATAVNAAGWQHVVASFHASGAPRAVGVATPIVAYRTGTFLDTQRRRIAPTGV